MKRSPTLSRSIVVLCFSIAPAAIGDPSYSVVDGGPLDGAFASDVANASGSVVSESSSAANTASRAFRWNGSTRNPGTLDGTHSGAPAIKVDGRVTGHSSLAGDAEVRGFLWNRTAQKELGALGGDFGTGFAINASIPVTAFAYLGGDLQSAFVRNSASARGLGLGALDGDSGGSTVNAAGWVTGNAVTGGAQHAFLWNGVAMKDLGTLGGYNSGGEAINADGWVTGYSQTANNAAEHAMLWDGTSLHDLGTLGGSNSHGHHISDSGWITGTSDVTDNLAQHAFLWDGANLHDLGTLGGTNSHGTAIISGGFVIGGAQIADDVEYHAFIWSSTGMVDLNSFLPADSTFVLEHAITIDDAGQILVHGRDRATGAPYAFLLSLPSLQASFSLTGFLAPVDNAPAKYAAKSGSSW